MSSNNMFSSSSYKPQRRLGRRSLAMSSNTYNNITLNGTMNCTAKCSSDFLPKRPYEPSCASTPLPDHTKNKENIFLSSIKPVLNSSPKSARRVPYQRRLGRRSMAAQRSQLEESALNDSLTRMKNINSTLKMTDPKTPSKTTGSQSSSIGGGLNFLDSLSFMKKYLPSGLPNVAVQPPSPSRSDDSLKTTKATECGAGRHVVQAEDNSAGSKLDYEAILKRVTSKSPAKSEANKYGSLLRNIQPNFESICETSESPTITLEAEQDVAKDGDGFHYGSFLGDTVEPRTMKEQKDEEMKELKEPEDKGDNLNRTFELEEEESIIFKTPLAPKYFKPNESTYKTPRLSVLNQFQMDDANDSFVENERTIMLQFRNEPVNTQATSATVCDTTSDVKKSLSNFVAEQRQQLEAFITEQAVQMRQFLDNQNKDYQEFLADQTSIDTTTQRVSKSIQESTMVNEVQTNTVVDSTTTKSQDKSKSKTPKRQSPVARTTRSTSKTSQNLTNLNESNIPHFESKMSNTIFDLDDDTTTFIAKPRQSLAFSNFKKNCSILKTPSRSRSSIANSTAVMTPGTLSTCIRDQLEQLEFD